MRITIIDNILACLSIIATVFISVVVTRLFGDLPILPVEFKGLGKCFIFVFTLFLIAGLSPRLIRVVCPLKEGIFFLDRDKRMLFWKLQGLFYDYTLNVLSGVMPMSLRKPFYSFLGAKIGTNVAIAGKIIEPSLVEIGDYSFLGADVVITAHSIENEKITFKKVRIGKNVTVGIRAVILPGVEIGNKSIIAAGAVVTKDTKIQPGEIWGGIPARKIRNKT